MITERCPCCVGKKTIVGLGAMIKDCPKCKGVGHIKKVQGVELDLVNKESIENVRRGRPKKVSDERKEA